MEYSKIKALIFDMDGLMFDTEVLYTKAFAAVAKDWNYENQITEELIMSIKGKKKEEIKRIFKKLLDPTSIERYGKEFDFDAYLKEILDYIDQKVIENGTPIKEGLLELLEFAKNNNLKIAIGTSEKTKRVDFYLDKANINKDFFDVIVTGDMVTNGKPAPDIFLKAAEKLGVLPEKTIVFEDAPNGIIAAYRANAKPVMIVDSIQPTNEIKELLYLPPLKSLRDAICEIKNNI